MSSLPVKPGDPAVDTVFTLSFVYASYGATDTYFPLLVQSPRPESPAGCFPGTSGVIVVRAPR